MTWLLLAVVAAAPLEGARAVTAGEYAGVSSGYAAFRLELPAHALLSARLQGSSDLELFVTDVELQILARAAGQEVLNLPFARATATYLVVKGDGPFTLTVSLPKPDPDRDCFEDCATLERMEGSTRFLAVPRGQGHFIVAPLRYAWGRRDLLGLLRYATRSVVERFPAKARDPMAIAEMSQQDGENPGTDAREPHHVEGSHENGYDADLGYYVTDGVSNWRIICGKGTDQNENGQPGRYNDGFFCTTGENVVDLEREVWFLSRLAESPRFRVVGVDVTLDPQIEAEARRLYANHEIGPAQLARLTSGVRSGAEGSWQFHHHHLHFSTVRDAPLETLQLSRSPSPAPSSASPRPSWRGSP